MPVRCLIVGVVLLSLSACSQQPKEGGLGQPGCTPENCKLIISACRVNFLGGPTQYAECSFNRPTGPADTTKYCVDACNAHLGNGKVASCLAAKAGECIDGGFANTFKLSQECSDPTAKEPEKTCDDNCLATQKACDEKCSGGRPCDACLRAGGNCENVCVRYEGDGGNERCLDCSAGCALKYVACSDSCPRAP